ncbi:MAG: excinuclease ABC subunit UvrC [Candidatus Lokiarchaeota archaeon]|nr:excinuclease ABC subunit UvrC [Candidatus Lokiarchaeota archaeon]
MSDLDIQRRSLPNEPGIYQFKNKKGKIIYIGKAKDLRKRVSSYFTNKSFNDPYYEEKIIDLVNRINSIEYIVTENEKEALILENIMIKKYRPRFNVFMRDSKSYPWVMITYSEEYPRIRLMRNPRHYDSDNLFLGPYTDKQEIQRILRDLRKVFPYCSCKKKIRKKDRPCLYYQLKLCPGPCIGKIDKKSYLENIKQIDMFLKGETGELKTEIEEKMKDAAENKNYEAAAYWRDKLQAIENTTTKQHVLLNDELDKDIIGYFNKVNYAAVVIIHVRDGKFTNKSPFTLNLEEKLVKKQDILTSLLEQYYQDTLHNLPDLIILSELYSSLELLRDYLRDSKRHLRIRTPLDADEYALLRIAQKNAKVMVNQQIEMEDLKVKEGEERKQILEEIKELLDLSEIPRIIEGFDISNIEGKDATGSMVYFLEGKPYNKKYRHYNIRSKSTPDDVGMMKEIVYRRYSKILERNGTLPDLILVDGGKGQLNAAKSILEDLGLKIPVISLAKRLEEIFTPENQESMILPENSPILKLFQHIRDEAHRFAVRLHKTRRKKKYSGSVLEEIKGIGPATRNKLLKRFGSIEGIEKASDEELLEIVKANLVKKIRKKLEKETN